jgi:hypothetical protein
MNMTEFQVQVNDNGLAIENEKWFSEQSSDSPWTAKTLGSGCLVVRNRATSSEVSPDPAAMMHIPSDLLRDLIEGLMLRSWSGVVGIDAGMGFQKIFLVDGELSFASSTLMDHRLGEVIYRNGSISLEKLTESTIQVTRSQKFGQVLLKGGAFTAVDLWDALRLQVLQIVRTAFIMPKVYVEIEPGKDLAPTSVVFAENSQQVIGDAYFFGCMYRDFINQVDFQGEISIKEDEVFTHDIKPGTFQSDTLELVREQKSLANIIAASKLHEVNTISAVMDFVNRGICNVRTGASSPSGSSTKLHRLLQAKLDAYSFMIREVRSAFLANSLSIPITDLRQFCYRLNPPGFISLYLDDQGDVHEESIRWIGGQSLANEQRAAYFGYRLEALTQFLLQVSGDLLPGDISRKLRNDFKDIRA